jgi:AraC-like DNA-binding protein
MKKVLITGAGTGFGHEVAMRLAEKGFEVIAGVEIYAQVQTLKRQAAARDVSLQVEKLDVRHALSVLLLRIGNHEHRSSQPRDAAFEAFRQSVENGFAHTHRVEDYARQLGYSVRTLTRTSRVATGYGAKRVIQERVLLEAKRLLVHTDLTSTAIAGHVGMPDPAAFGKFFRRQTGETPATFRDRRRGAANSG